MRLLAGRERFRDYVFEIPEHVVTYLHLLRAFPFLADVDCGLIRTRQGFVVSSTQLVTVGDKLWYGFYEIVEG